MRLIENWIAMLAPSCVLAFGGSSSRASTTNYSEVTTTTDNSNIGVQSEEGPAVAVRGDSNVINVTDGGAIEQAFQFGDRALLAVGDAQREALDFADEAGYRAFQFGDRALLAVGDATRGALVFARDTTRDALGFADQQGQRAFLFGSEAQRAVRDIASESIDANRRSLDVTSANLQQFAGRAIDAARDASKGDSERIADSLRLVVLAAAAVGIVIAFRSR